MAQFIDKFIQNKVLKESRDQLNQMLANFFNRKIDSMLEEETTMEQVRLWVEQYEKDVVYQLDYYFKDKEAKV